MPESEEMESRYDVKKTEEKIYKLWEESGFFNPDVCVAKGVTAPDAEPFCIIMPPTNANGSLHAGHGLVLAIEDIMTRFNRMRGKRTLWLPGLDHAGFETQVVYEKELEKQGRSRFGMDRKQLYDEILSFTLNNKRNIEGQTRKIGASCDWSREKFTLDDDVIKTVYETFKKLYKDGLVYRGKRIVSWCSKHQTSFSDLEIADVERTDPFYYLQYGPFVIGTARPETKFGDKYVCVHPDDERYKEYADGQKIDLEWINGPITATVVKDAAIDMSFGTGVMTITPWHDAADFDIAERHGLDKEQIIDEQGRLLPIAGEFEGMKIAEARPKILEKLAAKGLLVKTDEKYEHVVRTCYKCGTVIEPQIKEQWFVKMKPLAAPAIKAIESGEVAFIPEHYKKITLHWLTNIVDWNISRQIAWGIPIPAWYCGGKEKAVLKKMGFADTVVPRLYDGMTRGCGQVVISETKPAHCPACGGDGLERDTDTFDTWFSSGQWPFVTLNYPDGDDFKRYYPTDVMETAGEIIFFWVARMIMLGLYVTGRVPFKTVYLHGLVLDAKGKKMSKSKGNVIDPLELTAKYGTDAFRIGLVIGNTPGTSLALAEDRIRGYRNFATKIWNAARFVIMNKPAFAPPSPKATDGHSEDTGFGGELSRTAGRPAVANEPTGQRANEFAPERRAYLDEFSRVKGEVTEHLERFEFHLAGEKAYHYFWHTFADKIIEEEKKRLRGENERERQASYALLEHILIESLKMLHPFMPFVTEAIYQKLKPGTLLMTERW